MQVGLEFFPGLLKALSTNKAQVCGCKYPGSTGYIQTIHSKCDGVLRSSISFFLNQKQKNKLENIQKTCLKVIYGEDYFEYDSALVKSGLEKLSDRRLKRCLDFSLKCLNNSKMQKMFPRNPNFSERVRHSEPFFVKFASTNTYRKSAIPFCHRLLNKHFEEHNEK